MKPPVRRSTEIATARTRLRPAIRLDYQEWMHLRAINRDHLEPWEPAWSVDALSHADWKRHLVAWRASWQLGRGYGFQIRLAGNGELVGGVNLTNVRRGVANMASLGYWLGADYEGQGLMFEATQAVCDWAFDDLGLERIEAGTLPENARSRKLLERLGFQEEGLARAYLRIAAKRRDHVIYGLVRTCQAD